VSDEFKEHCELINTLFSEQNTWPSIEAAKPWLNLRSIDGNWAYRGVLPTLFSGFNPFSGRVQIPENSYIRKIAFGEFSKGAAVLPELSPGRLTREVLFAFHDYIHCCIVTFCFDLVKKDLRIDRLASAEKERVIYHILALSEVSATVGLDYWRLTRRGIGLSHLEGYPYTGLTTSFTRINQDQSLLKFIDSSDFFYHILGLFLGHRDEAIQIKSEWYEREVTQAAQFRRLMHEWIDFRLKDTGDVERRSNNDLDEVLKILSHRVCDFTEEFSYGNPGGLHIVEPKDVDVEIFGAYRDRFENPRFQSITSSDFGVNDELWVVLQDLPQRHYAYFVGQYHSAHRYQFEGLDYRSRFDRLIVERDRNGLIEFGKSAVPVKSTPGQGDAPMNLVFPS